MLEYSSLITLLAPNGCLAPFNLGGGRAMWRMWGKKIPTQIRGSGIASAGFAQSMANAAARVRFLALAASSGLLKMQTGYALFAAVSFVFVRAKVNETRGRELEATRSWSRSGFRL